MQANGALRERLSPVMDIFQMSDDVDDDDDDDSRTPNRYLTIDCNQMCDRRYITNH